MGEALPIDRPARFLPNGRRPTAALLPQERAERRTGRSRSGILTLEADGGKGGGAVSAMSNDAKLGLVLGVGIVILIGVLSVRPDAAPSPGRPPEAQVRPLTPPAARQSTP